MVMGTETASIDTIVGGVCHCNHHASTREHSGAMATDRWISIVGGAQQWFGLGANHACGLLGHGLRKGGGDTVAAQRLQGAWTGGVLCCVWRVAVTRDQLCSGRDIRHVLSIN